MRYKNLALLLALLVTMVLPPSIAHATSAYDNYYNKTENLILTRDGCTPLGIEYTWQNYLGSYTASFEEAKVNGSWGVSYLPNYSVSSGMKAAIVYWDEAEAVAAFEGRDPLIADKAMWRARHALHEQLVALDVLTDD